jgi:hypothetical protein
VNYELRHFNTVLLRFSAAENSNTPDINIYWVNEERKDLLEQNLDYLLDSRDEKGLFRVTWNWENGYEEFELQRIKWMGVILVNNLVFLKKYNRILA